MVRDTTSKKIGQMIVTSHSRPRNLLAYVLPRVMCLNVFGVQYKCVFSQEVLLYLNILNMKITLRSLGTPSVADTFIGKINYSLITSGG